MKGFDGEEGKIGCQNGFSKGFDSNIGRILHYYQGCSCDWLDMNLRLLIRPGDHTEIRYFLDYVIG